MSVTGVDSVPGPKVTSRNATDETARAGLIRSRNLHRIDYRLLAAAKKEAQEQVERTRQDVEKGAGFFVFMKALRERAVPEEVEANRRVDEANRAARLCGQCGRCLDDREAVYIAPRVYAGIAVLARKPKFYRAPVCGGCAPVDISERKDTYGDRTYNVYVDEPCGGCGLSRSAPVSSVFGEALGAGFLLHRTRLYPPNCRER
jgi:hypothetical protein